MITPERFWEKFAERLHKKLKKLAMTEDWTKKYKSSKEWTKIMMPLLETTGNDLGFRKPREISKEFYRIDMGYYRVFGPIKNGSGKDIKHNWDLEVAIEHENDYRTWYYEFVKLVHINCGLKVIITYHDYRNSKLSLDKKLDTAKQLYSLRRYKQIPDNWLLIFGPTSSDVKDKDFVAYKFDGKDINPLANKRIIL